MSACTLVTASNAASIAACMSPGAAPATVISTNVPSSGRARRAVASLAGRIFCGKPVSTPDRVRGRLFPENALFEAGGNGHDPLHAFGHVMRRQGGTGNIADVVAHLQRTR